MITKVDLINKSELIRQLKELPKPDLEEICFEILTVLYGDNDWEFLADVDFQQYVDWYLHRNEDDD